MKVKTMVGTLIFLVVLNLGVLATIVYLNVSDRQPPIARFMNPEPTFRAPFGRHMEMPEELTPEQEDKLVELVQSYQAEIRPLRDEIRFLEEEMFNALLIENDIDSSKARKTLREISELRLEMGVLALERLQEAKSFLSEEQQEVFIRRIMAAGRGPGQRPAFGPNGPNSPRLNRPPINQQ